MDTKEKLDLIQKDIIESAQKSKTKIFIENISDIREDFSCHFQKCVDNALEEIKIKKDEFKYQRSKSVTEFINEYKKNILRFRAETTDKLFKEAKIKIKAFTKSDDYIEYMLNDLKKIKHENPIIEFSCCDTKLIEHAKTKFDYKFILSKEDFLGGFRIYLDDPKVIIDKSFEARLDIIKRDFNLFKLPIF